MENGKTVPATIVPGATLDYETDDYKVRALGRVTVVRLKNPNLTSALEVNRITDEIKGMIDSGILKLVLCFKHVEHCGSAGLGMMIAINKKIKDAGGRLVLSHPENIEELLRISKTASMFKIASDPKAAVHLF